MRALEKIPGLRHFQNFVIPVLTRKQALTLGLAAVQDMTETPRSQRLLHRAASAGPPPGADGHSRAPRGAAIRDGEQDCQPAGASWQDLTP